MPPSCSPKGYADIPLGMQRQRRRNKNPRGTIAAAPRIRNMLQIDKCFRFRCSSVEGDGVRGRCASVFRGTFAGGALDWKKSVAGTVGGGGGVRVSCSAGCSGTVGGGAVVRGNSRSGCAGLRRAPIGRAGVPAAGPLIPHRLIISIKSFVCGSARVPPGFPRTKTSR